MNADVVHDSQKIEKYIKNPVNCLNCESPDIESSPPRVGDGENDYHCVVHCYNCRYKWVDVYTVTRVEAVEFNSDSVFRSDVPEATM